MRSDGLILDFEASVDVTPGTTEVLDISGFGHDGAWTNGAVTQLPSGLWVLDFDEDNAQSLLINNSPMLEHGINNMTIDFWFYKDIQQSNYRRICEKTEQFRILTNHGADNKIYFEYFKAGGSYQPQAFVITTGVWTHCVWTLSDSSTISYRNGIKSTGYTEVRADDMITKTANLYIGCRTPTEYELTGKVAFFRMYNYALSPGQVLARYNSTKRWFEKP